MERFTSAKFFQELLPEGISYIDHSILDALEPGLVKTYGKNSEFVSVRATWSTRAKLSSRTLECENALAGKTLIAKINQLSQTIRKR